MQRLWCWVVALVVLVPVAGCGPNLSERDLGEVVYEMPQFPKNTPSKPETHAASPAADETAQPAGTAGPAAPQK